MWDELEAMFDAVDTSGDGEIDGAEAAAAMEALNPEGHDVKFPTEAEVEAWVRSELAKDGDITKAEAKGAIDRWAESQGVVIPDEVWDVLEAGFDHIDANSDGKITGDELKAAFA